MTGPAYTDEQIQENRRTGVQHLLTTDHGQAFVTLWDSDTECACALGELGIAVGIHPRPDGGARRPYTEIDRAYGIFGERLSTQINRWNDKYSLPFREIGLKLAREWGIKV